LTAPVTTYGRPQTRPDDPVLRVRSLDVRVGGGAGVPLVRGVSFDLDAGEIVGVVGESGSGKSMTALAILGLLPRGIVRHGGEVLFKGEDLGTATPARLRQIRGKGIAMISQDPGQALNPVHRIGRQVAEPMRLHERVSRKVRRARVRTALEKVGIADAARRATSYPFEFSGGMRQRAMIGMALVCEPSVLIADEPTTGLDVTVQMQVLDLIRSLATELNMSTLLVSHDLKLVAGVCDRVQVMYAGRIVESGPTAAVLGDPRHPYTQALVRAVPSEGMAVGTELFTLPGSPPEPSASAVGCPLFDRCVHRHALCREEEPELLPLEPGHEVACWVRPRNGS
jgi:oligopeptide/dipeptide ABC transporter ATP-binding protein